jgi:hypothetical protein
MEPNEEALRSAIATISQSDPLIKLLQQVRIGRMTPSDAGLRAVTESWLGTYEKVIATAGWTKQELRRIDPMPRVAVLIQAGVLTADHPAVIAVQRTFEEAIARATG